MNTLNPRVFLRTRSSIYYYSVESKPVESPRVLLRKSQRGFSGGEPVQLTEDNYEELKRKRAIHGKKTNKFIPCDFLGTKDEEFANQQRLLETSFVEIVGRIKASDAKAKGELVERFKKYWVECSQTIQVYHGSEIEEEKEQFEEFCDHCLIQLAAMKDLIPPKLFKGRLFERFFRYSFGISCGFQLVERPIRHFSLMVEYGIPITGTIYWRMLNNYAENKDLENVIKVWDLIPKEQRNMEHCYTAHSCSLDNLTHAVNVLHFIAFEFDREGLKLTQNGPFVTALNEVSAVNVNNLERIILSCREIAQFFVANPNLNENEYKKQGGGSVYLVTERCAQAAFNAWDRLSCMSKYVNQEGDLLVYESLIDMCQYLPEDGARQARWLFGEIVNNRLAPRIETINLLLWVHLKFNEMDLARNIFSKVNFSLPAFEPNDLTRSLANTLGQELELTNKS